MPPSHNDEFVWCSENLVIVWWDLTVCGRKSKDWSPGVSEETVFSVSRVEYPEDVHRRYPRNVGNLQHYTVL
jgi:hypothetical protein